MSSNTSGDGGRRSDSNGKGEVDTGDVDEVVRWLEEDDADILSWLSQGKSGGSTAKVIEDAEQLKQVSEQNGHLNEENQKLKDELSRLQEENVRLEAASQTGVEGDESVTVKELRERFVAELREKEGAAQQKERALNEQLIELGHELERRRIEDALRDEGAHTTGLTSSERETELESKVEELQDRLKTLMLVEKEAARLRIDLRERDDELSKIRDMVAYKENENNRREEDLMYREKLISEEARRLEGAKLEAEKITGELDMKRRLEELKSQVETKEKELMAKEKFLNVKREELRQREQGIIEDEIVAREEDRAIEVQAAKVKTGNTRFDDLLLGGIPFGSNILIHGPPFVGKEVMVCQFMAEGLRKGIPVIWITTDKTPDDIRMEMEQVVSGYREYEGIGLVRYVDAYSRTMGDLSDDPHTIYVLEPTDHEGLEDAVDKVANEFKEKHDHYRLAFRSVSTFIAYSDPNTAFRFLNPFCGRRKKDRAVSMYTLEKGMHGEQEIQMLGMIMDGMVDFKVDQLKTYFAIKGISEVQSRAFIRYDSNIHGLNIGSFSLDHIR